MWSGPGAVEQHAPLIVFDAETGGMLRTLTLRHLLLLDLLGQSVSLYGDKALISAIGGDLGATNTGSAYLLDINTGALLRTFANPTPVANEQFGYSLREQRAHQRPIRRTAATGSGAAYLFDINTGSLLQTFLNPTPALNDTRHRLSLGGQGHHRRDFGQHGKLPQ